MNWPVRHLEAVFNSFDIDPAIAGWGEAKMLPCPAPWDLAILDAPIDEAAIEQERQRLPKGYRLVGCYGRLVKVTQPYLRAVERILLECPDTAFVVPVVHTPIVEKL